MTALKKKAEGIASNHFHMSAGLADDIHAALVEARAEAFEEAAKVAFQYWASEWGVEALRRMAREARELPSSCRHDGGVDDRGYCKTCGVVP